MSGIYVPGMEMPTACCACPCNYDNVCAITNKYPTFEEWYEIKPSWCPLIPVPDHGRLIDADALTKMCREMQSIDWNKKASPYSWEHAYEEFENDIDEAPTIIEAEEGE